MSIFITSLNSGSNGNCYYIGNSTDAVLIDAGLPCRETDLRMQRLGLDMSIVKAIFVSHEHHDHVSGIPTLLKRYKVPVFITSATLRNGRIRFDASLINHFSAYTPVTIGSLSITAFPKFHDACDPHSFIVSDGNVNIGVFTDIGQTCEQVTRHFSVCHAAFLESNYDEAMLSDGKYPWYLKHRITGGKGHLSNKQALEIFLKYRHPHLSHLFLAHLSKENNCPDLVARMFGEHAGNTNIMVASRYAETPLFEIIRPATPVPLPKMPVLSGRVQNSCQLSLF